MEKGHGTIRVATLRASRLFVLRGPGDVRLACEWCEFQGAHARGDAFRIVRPPNPGAEGHLFGTFDYVASTFRMRRAMSGDPSFHFYEPHLDLDLDWRGGLDDVLDVGDDWCLGSDGRIEICHGASDADLIDAMTDLAA